MAHWAEIDKNNVVVRVTVGDNNDPAGDEGYQWLIDNLGGTWIKTSYNTRKGVHIREELNEDGSVTWVLTGKPQLRKNFACIGMTYDPTRDAFIPPKPEGNWELDEETCTWKEIGA